MAEARWTAPPWWLKFFNKINSGLRRLGVPLRPSQLLTLRGRRSGMPRTTPVTPLTVDAQRYVIGGFANADWIANARANGEATLRHGRRAQTVRLVELTRRSTQPASTTRSQRSESDVVGTRGSIVQLLDSREARTTVASILQ